METITKKITFYKKTCKHCGKIEESPTEAVVEYNSKLHEESCARKKEDKK